MDFKGLLTKWNGGIERGAQLRFARKIGVDQSNVRRWIQGWTSPNEELRPKIAKELGVTVESLMASFSPAGRGTASVLRDAPAAIYRARPVPGASPPDWATIMGRLDQLTKQVADVQETCGQLKYRMDNLEGRLTGETKAGSEKKINKSA